MTPEEITAIGTAACEALREFGETSERLLRSCVSQLSEQQLVEYKRLLDSGELPFDALAKIK